ncbi:MAG: TetR/AcrR family transcriptional regulator [Lachnospiraceae bacterium]|nr:TetR/AcrR family transcriptional regulator [Lachnospiraceae bacterium]
MDLRTKKTEEAIRNTFLALRSKYPLEKITVKTLCEQARINKSTFYAHYADIFALSDTLQQEVVDDILKSIENSPARTPDNRDAWTKEIYLSAMAHASLTDILFEGRESGKLVMLLDAGVKEIFFKRYPELQNNVRHRIILSYSVQGAYYAYANNRDIDSDTVLAVLEDIVSAVSEIY